MYITVRDVKSLHSQHGQGFGDMCPKPADIFNWLDAGHDRVVSTDLLYSRPAARKQPGDRHGALDPPARFVYE
jgi:hypothetical protein